MIQVTKQYRTETGHRLHPYDGKCSHFHGHSYLWEVTVGTQAYVSDLDAAGMVADFKIVKEAMVEVLEPFDHAMVLGYDDPIVKAHGDKLSDLLRATNEADPRLFIMPFNPTAENFAAWGARTIQANLPAFLEVTRVVVWETATSFATWGK